MPTSRQHITCLCSDANYHTREDLGLFIGLFACPEWAFICFFRNCGDMGGGLCSSWNSRILFGWAKNAQGITMPPGAYTCFTCMPLEEL